MIQLVLENLYDQQGNEAGEKVEATYIHRTDIQLTLWNAEGLFNLPYPMIRIDNIQRGDNVVLL